MKYSILTILILGVFLIGCNCDKYRGCADMVCESHGRVDAKQQYGNKYIIRTGQIGGNGYYDMYFSLTPEEFNTVEVGDSVSHCIGIARSQNKQDLLK